MFLDIIQSEFPIQWRKDLGSVEVEMLGKILEEEIDNLLESVSRPKSLFSW